jgi:hypothetical protein
MGFIILIIILWTSCCSFILFYSCRDLRLTNTFVASFYLPSFFCPWIYSATTTFGAVSSRRTISSRKVIDDIKNKPIWLEDPATYPVIACTVVACVGAAGYVLYIQTCKEYIRWAPSKRCSEIRWWGDDKADLRFKKV